MIGVWFGKASVQSWRALAETPRLAWPESPPPARPAGPHSIPKAAQRHDMGEWDT